MISKYGDHILAPNHTFITLENILCMDGHLKLEGLTRVKPIKLYLEGFADEPINLKQGSLTANEIWRAANTLYKKGYNENKDGRAFPLIITKNRSIINMSKIRHMMPIREKGIDCYRVFFKSKEYVDIRLSFYYAIMDSLSKMNYWH